VQGTAASRGEEPRYDALVRCIVQSVAHSLTDNMKCSENSFVCS